MALLPWRKGTVIRIEKYTHNTNRFWIQVPDVNVFDFTPGQFVTLDLPIHEKPNKRWRSYSIASWPDGTNIFELLIVRNPVGLGTKYLFDEVTVGTELTFRGAQGVFTLPANLDKEIFFICTGTGVAPFRSMLQYIRQQSISFQKIHLVFGCRYQKDLLYYEEMRELEKLLSGFYYHPVLSREQWNGHQGYVHSVYENLCRGNPNAEFYLCGWKNMIDEARKRIHNMGYNKKAIHFELYG